MHYYASFITLLSLTSLHKPSSSNMQSVCVFVCYWLCKRLCVWKVFSIYLIGIIKSQLNMNEVHLKPRQKSLELLTWTHTYGCCSIFLRIFLYFYYSRNPYLSKNVMLCKILFMSFHVKTTLFHRFNKFPLCEERKTTTMAAANICQDIVRECVCVYVCRYVYE